MKRRQRVADIVFQMGAHALDEAELEVLLLNHKRDRAGLLN